MITQTQREKAQCFSELHKRNKMFILPNAWDVGSAYIFEKQGFEAVATSSAGIAYALGFPDGEAVSFTDLLHVVEKMAARVSIPLSVDFERGYGETNDAVKDNARRLLEAGAVGFNIEDGLPDGTLSPVEVQTGKIRALAELKSELDIDFVINARTCAYWLDVSGDDDKLKIATERGNAFIEAGADCVFIPGAINEETVAKLVKGINGPINIILNGAFNDFKRLDQLGVRRLSVGSAPVRLILNKTIELADSLMNGKVTDLLSNDFTYAHANSYFNKGL